MHKTITFISLLFFNFFIYAQTVTTVTDGAFSDGLAKDSQGNIYGSDWSGNTVYKLDTDGTVTVFKNGFSNPNGIGINTVDEIFICDHTANVIRKYDTNGTLITTYSTGLTTPAGIKSIPNSTDMLIVEYGTPSSNSTIKRLTTDGTITTIFSGTPLNGPAGIAFIGDTAYIANFNDRKILKLENGMLTLVAQLPNSAPNSNFLGFLSAVGNTLVATQIGENKIYAITPSTGAVNVYAGSTAGNLDGDINAATFSAPNGILGDTANNRIYVSDATPKNLRIIDNALLSVNEFALSNFKVQLFPNPTVDTLNIKIKNAKIETLNISIYNTLGKTVLEKEYSVSSTNFQIKLNTNNLTSGLYHVVIASKDYSITKKIIF